MSKLICPDCRHENEVERVYCHNCGARLDRNALTPSSTAVAQVETSEETQKRVRRMVNPRGAKYRSWLTKSGKLLAASCAAAALFEILSAPALPAQREFKELGPQIGLDLETAVTNHRGGTLAYSEDDVNSYLASAFRRKRKDLDKPLLEFENGSAAFDNGTIHFTVSRSLFGYSLYTEIDYNVALVGGKFATHNCGGALGRLPVHPILMQYGDALFADVWKALESDRKQLAKMSAIEFRPRSVVLTAPMQ